MKNLFILLCLLMLSACGGGGGSGGSSASGGGGGGTPPPVPVGSVAGAGFDGLILNGDVAVYDFSKGTKGALLATGTTDTTGLYNLRLQLESQPILIEVTGGYYLEEAGTGFQVQLGQNHKLTALVNYVVGSNLQVSTTTFTHIAAGLAQFEISKASSVVAAINDANGRISALAGFNILATTPKMITDSANASVSLTPELRYGFLAGAISMWTNDHSPTPADAHKVPYTSIDFAQLIFNDIAADGMLDGMGFDSTGALTQISFGNTPLTVDVYRRQLGVSMLKMANNQNNRTSLKGADLLPYVQNYIASTDTLFNNIVPVSIVAPSISIASPAADAVIIGNANINATVATAGEVVSSSLYIDGGFVAASTNPSAPSFVVDSNAYADGVHTIMITSVDSGGLSTSKSVSVLVVNNAPSISISNPSTNTVVVGMLTINGTAASSVGLSSVALSVDGVPAQVATNLLSPSLTIDTTLLQDGLHSLTLTATDIGGRTSSQTVTVNVANIAPLVTITAPGQSSLVRGIINLTASASSQSGLSSVVFLVDGSTAGSAQNLNAPAISLDTTFYADGAHTLSVRATDVGGSVTQADITGVTFSNVPPSVSVVDPANNSIIRGTIPVTATVTSTIGVSSIELLADGNVLATNVGSSVFSLNTNALTEGNHVIGVRANDAGGLSTTVTRNVMVNNVAPSVSIGSPAVNAVLKSSVTVTGLASSAVGLQSVQLLIDGTAAANATNLSVPTFQVDTAGYADGAHTLVLRAIGTGGLTSDTAPLSVVVANVAPAITFTAPAANAIVRGTVPVSSTITSGAGLSTLGLSVDGVFTAWLNPTTGSGSFTSASFADGAHVLKLDATDIGGNLTTITLPVVINNVAPSVSVSSPGNGSLVRRVFTVSGVASSAAGLSSVELLVDGASKGFAANPNAASFSFNSSAVADGAHTLQFVATSSGGLVSTSAANTVTVDNAAPSTMTITIGSCVGIYADGNHFCGTAPGASYFKDTLGVVTPVTAGAYSWNVLTAYNTAANVGGVMQITLYDAVGNCSIWTNTNLNSTMALINANACP